MSEYDNNNRGALFQNDNKKNELMTAKRANDTDAMERIAKWNDLRGPFTLYLDPDLVREVKKVSEGEGFTKEMELAAWKKTAKTSGKEFYSLSMNRPWKELKEREVSESRADTSKVDDNNDDLPF